MSNYYEPDGILYFGKLALHLDCIETEKEAEHYLEFVILYIMRSNQVNKGEAVTRVQNNMGFFEVRGAETEARGARLIKAVIERRYGASRQTSGLEPQISSTPATGVKYDD